MEKIIIEFVGSGCGNCKAFAPIFNQVKAEYPDIKFIEVSTDTADDRVEEFGVTTLPTLVFMRDGKFVDKMAGLKPKGLVIKKIQEIF